MFRVSFWGIGFGVQGVQDRGVDARGSGYWAQSSFSIRGLEFEKAVVMFITYCTRKSLSNHLDCYVVSVALGDSRYLP